MKYPIVYSIFVSAIAMTTIQGQSLDTLYVNSRQVVSLSFETPIQKGITGSTGYTFTFNREDSENLGLLQGQDALASNLLVQTSDGLLYGFILASRANLTQLHHFVPNHKSLKNPNEPKSRTRAEQNTPRERPAMVENKFAKYCQQLLDRKRSVHQVKHQKGIRIRVLESIYHGNEVYVGFELKNSSAIPYELGLLQLYKVLGTKKRKASYQELPLLPLYMHQMPKTIGSGASARFVVVYPKFTLNEAERLQLKVLETNGNRNFTFKLR